jgi:hypothetical protein
VLAKDDFLFPEATDVETYVEFVAVYLELRYFRPEHVAWYFPAVEDWEPIDALLRRDVPHEQLFESTILSAPSPGKVADDVEREAPLAARSGLAKPQFAWKVQTRQRQARARRAAAAGNGVKAAILQTALIASSESNDEAVTATQAAESELKRVVTRLQPVLCFAEEDVERWTSALRPLLGPASHGIWPVESRLLYDLQKVCVEHERGVFRLDIAEWARGWGRQPLRRSLPLLREVLISKHLKTALRRVSATGLKEEEREQLARLLSAAAVEAEGRTRDRLRPLANQVFDMVRLLPQNVPERVARQNVVEELLDVIVEQGVATLGHLRDAISRNDIKQPDLASLWELVRGDQLLRADRQLSRSLAGVYRPGAVYLRFAQRLSSLAFGTGLGRFLTQNLVLPFGGALLIIEGVRHLMGFSLADSPLASPAPVTSPDGGLAAVDLPPAAANAVPPAALAASPHGSPMSVGTLSAVVVLGCWLLLLMRSPPFRKWCLEQLHVAWNTLRVVMVEWPTELVRSPLVQNILRSAAYAAVRSYLLWPVALAMAIGSATRMFGTGMTRRTLFEVFLLTALFLNSRVGRYVDERVRDILLRFWQDVRMRIISALFDWVMETFQRLFVFLERFVYSVDEWLRFRAGDHRGIEMVKLAAGTCWFFVSYFVILAFTLLIEPQINPIKHFPVVTVSHKLLLPAGPTFASRLAPYIGITRANTVIWSTIWLIPGVFGFLVWELRENWRLYEANRPRQLSLSPVGSHGETMARLLRLGFHSGTIPKLFARLRSALRKSPDARARSTVQRLRAALHHVEEAVARFVERKLLLLWHESGCLGEIQPFVADVHLATSRIRVSVACPQHPERPMILTWEDRHGVLYGSVEPQSWADDLNGSQSEAFNTAIDGLFQRSGADSMTALQARRSGSDWEWPGWATYWTSIVAPRTPEPKHPA